MKYKVSLNAQGQRLDRFLTDETISDSRTTIKEWIKKGFVTVNQQQEKSSYKVIEGDKIEVCLPKESQDTPLLSPEPMDLDIVYEDTDIIVVNKPQNLVVHPSPNHLNHTLVNGLLDHVLKHHEQLADSPNGEYRPGIVHRIDKDTSGLLVVAKTELALENLTNQVSNHSMSRKYMALVYGDIAEESGQINVPIKRHPVDRLRYEGHPEGRQALTYFKVLERFNQFTLLELSLATGRTHQIRVHLQFINHPVADDPLYSRDHKQQFFTTNGQLLHAYQLTLNHPRSGELMTFEADLPYTYQSILENLRHEI